MTASDYFPFGAWGLRGNPFQALTREEWAQVAIVPSAVRAALKRNPEVQALQLLGEAGAGKTSTLLALEREEKERDRPCLYAYIPRGSRRLCIRLPQTEMLILDEAQRLHPLALRRIFRWLRRFQHPGLRLAWSAHKDLLPAARRARIEACSVTLDGPSQVELRQILHRRLSLFALPDGPRLSFDPDAVAFLAQEFQADLGGMEAFLYEFFQRAAPAPAIRREALAEFRAGFNARPA